jgi:opacity protein-like surface antigen
MKTLSTWTMVLVAAGLVPVNPAQAENRGPGWEFGIDGIYQLDHDIAFNGGSSVSLHDAFGLTVVLGYRFGDRFEVQYAIDWLDANYDLVIQSAPPTLPAVQFSGSGEMQSITPRISVNYNLLSGPITPYVNAGVGRSFIDTNIPAGRPQNECWFDPWWGSICGTVQSTKNLDEFTYQAGVGLRWDFKAGYTLRFAYEKHWMDLGEATSTPDSDQFKIGMSFKY